MRALFTVLLSVGSIHAAFVPGNTWQPTSKGNFAAVCKGDQGRIPVRKITGFSMTTASEEAVASTDVTPEPRALLKQLMSTRGKVRQPMVPRCLLEGFCGCHRYASHDSASWTWKSC